MLKNYGLSAFVSLAVILAVGIGSGLGAAFTVAILVAIEIAFSLDNAIINARVLERLPRFWQTFFLTAGALIAIVGMRAVFPVLIVMFSAHLSWGEVVKEALHNPTLYSHHLTDAHIAISAFGGGFLLCLALYFLLDDNRKELWLEKLEGMLQKAGNPLWLPPLLSAVVIILLGAFATKGRQVLTLGLIGIASYTFLKLLVDGLGKLEPNSKTLYKGKLALLAVLYLEVLDASFSFDGVLGAFAITGNIVYIALGLGVGAIWVRSLTISLVHKQTLRSYIYLEHGAHYAILGLAIALLAGIFISVPDGVTGGLGLAFIAASFLDSRKQLQNKETASA